MLAAYAVMGRGRIGLLEITTTNGDRYIVMGQRILRNHHRMKYLDCPVVLWVGCCNKDGSVICRRPCRGKHLCVKFNSGLYIGGIINEIRESC